MSDGRMLGRDVVDDLLRAAQAEPRVRVIALSGAPQSGKSRATAEFAKRCGADAFRVLLTEDDTTLFAFIRALVHAMGPIARGAQLSFNAMQARLSTPEAIPQIVSWLDAHVGVDAWLVVDNVEVLKPQSPVSNFLLAMVERSPRVRWLFAGRSLDALPLETWTAREEALSFETAQTDTLPVTRTLARLDETERELLASIAPLRTLEPRLIEAILGEAGTLLVRRLHDRLPALFEAGASLHLHRDVRRALLEQLQSLGENVIRSAILRCGIGLERFEFYEELVALYLRNRAYDALEDLLARRGLVLADHVNADTLDAALQAVSDDSPGVRSLQAILASRRGHYHVAEKLFENAARMASQPLAAQIQYAYGCDLLRRNRPDCAPIFERLLDSNVPGAPHQSEVRSALAQAYVLCENPQAALEQIKFALHVSSGAPDSAVVKTRAAYVYFYAAHDLELAGRIASDALAQALQARTYTVAVGAASLVYNVACERDNQREAMAALEVLADCGVKVGNVAFASYALIAMLEFHVEAGDLARIARNIETLSSFDISYESLVASEALAAAEAMRRSWRGEFAGAYELLYPTASQAVGEDYRALREAQLAYFAAGANRFVEAREHVDRALNSLGAIDRNTHKAVRARIFIGLAMSALGDASAAREQFRQCAQPASRFPRLRAVREGAILIHEWMHGHADPGALSRAFAEMHRRGAGGFAMMFDEFPRPRARTSGGTIGKRAKVLAEKASTT